MKYNLCPSMVLNCQKHIAMMGTLVRKNRSTRLLSVVMLTLAFFLLGANGAFADDSGKTHLIELWAERIMPGYEGGNDLFAYRMKKHLIQEDGSETDVTWRYPDEPTIPGPTIVIDEGDQVELTLRHKFDPGDDETLEQVSVHVHGVHYDIESDGTLEYINLVRDQSAINSPTEGMVMSYVYHWTAAPGTAGTWPYHDHNMLTLNGAEDRGLYGAVIVNDHADIETVNGEANTTTSPFSNVGKEYVLFIGDDAFWGTEIDNRTGQQTPLGDNPTLSAARNSYVRFHLIALGTNSHLFRLAGYRWPDSETNLVIQDKAIGALEKHVFAIRANHSSVYEDLAFASRWLGMQGQFKVTRR